MAASILIVEDEESILELIAINLHQAGFNPIRSLSAEFAEKIIQKKSTRSNHFRLDASWNGWGRIC